MGYFTTYYTEYFDVGSGPTPPPSPNVGGALFGGGGGRIRWRDEREWRVWAREALEYFARRGQALPADADALLADAPIALPSALETPSAAPPWVRELLAAELARALARPARRGGDDEDDDEAAILLLME